MTDSIFIVMDLDDTLFKAEFEMTKWINKNIDPDFVWKNRLSRTDPVEAPLLHQVLEDGEFMATCGFREGFEVFPQLIREMQVVFGERLKFMFCTHRGYHPRAAERTQILFDRVGLSLEGVFLDFETYPCKKTWLDETFKDQIYYLFDDNPHWVGGSSEDVSNIFLIDQPWNQNETGYERLFTFDDVKQKIFDCAIKHLA